MSYPLPQIVNLPYFAEYRDADSFHFKWPKVEDLQSMNLNEPLVLKEIRTKGSETNYLKAIQLVF